MSDDTSAPISGLFPQPQEQQQPAIPPEPGPPPMPWPEPAWQQGFSPQPPPQAQAQPPQQPQPQPQPEGWPVTPTQSIAPQPGFPPPPVPPPPGVGRRRRPPLWALIVGGVALVGLVVGLLVWAPWSPPPQPPTAVRVSSPTATTALVSWTAPKGGAAPAQYNIMRDGKEQGIVPGSQTSWTDTGLTPGSKHAYTVTTVGNGQNSAPSAITSVTTIAPPPADVTETDQTYTTVTLHWSPPPNAPTPDLYTVYDTSSGKYVLDNVGGAHTSYTVTQLIPGDDYKFAVTATWGPAVSALTPNLVAPPLSVPLSGSVPVNIKVTRILPGSTGITNGETWTDNWNFTASCQVATCTLTDKGSLISNISQFTAKLTPANGGYQGQATHVQFSHCGGVDSYNTFIIRIYPDNGGVSHGAWTSWHGTLTIVTPDQTVSTGSCTGGDWLMALTGTGLGQPGDGSTGAHGGVTLARGLPVHGRTSG